MYAEIDNIFIIDSNKDFFKANFKSMVGGGWTNRRANAMC